MNHDIFISYSRDDKKAVFPLVEKINEELGTHCWVDLNGVESGEQFEEKIMSAIDASKIVLFMLSDNSLKSPWTKREVYYAEKRKKRIIPVVVDGEGLRDWFLFHFQSVDYIDIKSKDQCKKMIKDLKKWVNSEREETIVKKTKDNKITNDNNHTPKNKLWIVLTAIVAALVLLTVFLKLYPTGNNTIKEETVVVQQRNPDDVDFNNCKTIADYREYMAIYGRRGIHYKEAKQTVDEHVADSMAKATSEAEQKEKDAYNKCTTIAACDNYLILYPDGKYVSEVKAKKNELEKMDDHKKAEKAKNRNGVFSVSATKKVEFSKGNLQYQASTKTWRFAEHQWDMIGDANKNISSSYNGWIDLFGWGTGNDPTKHTENSADYRVFYDWGNNVISNEDGKKWRTLTREEWRYVVFRRKTDSGVRYVKAKVNGINGLVLLPDNWSNSIYSLNRINEHLGSFTYNNISIIEWVNIFERNGAIFLPATGLRFGVIYEPGMIYGSSIETGDYWSSTRVNGEEEYSYSLFFNYNLIQSYNYDDICYGSSVRLVSDVEW